MGYRNFVLLHRTKRSQLLRTIRVAVPVTVFRAAMVTVAVTVPASRSSAQRLDHREMFLKGWERRAGESFNISVRSFSALLFELGDVFLVIA